MKVLTHFSRKESGEDTLINQKLANLQAKVIKTVFKLKDKVISSVRVKKEEFKVRQRELNEEIEQYASDILDEEEKLKRETGRPNINQKKVDIIQNMINEFSEDKDTKNKMLDEMSQKFS